MSIQPFVSNVALTMACCLLMSSAGCRVQLPSCTQSNLWSPTVEDRADWQLTQMGQCSNPTHRSKLMSGWTKGYYRGYQAGAYSVNVLPPANYPAVWSEKRQHACADEQAILQGYHAGYHQAVIDGPINVVVKK